MLFVSMFGTDMAPSLILIHKDGTNDCLSLGSCLRWTRQIVHVSTSIPNLPLNNLFLNKKEFCLLMSTSKTTSSTSLYISNICPSDNPEQLQQHSHSLKLMVSKYMFASFNKEFIKSKTKPKANVDKLYPACISTSYLFVQSCVNDFVYSQLGFDKLRIS